MRILVSMILFLFLGINSVSAHYPPPQSSITISGKVTTPFTKVGLFPDVHHNKPMILKHIKQDTREYSITINTKNHFRDYGNNQTGADLIFWEDKNNNGVKDKGETKTECHFIIWNSSKKEMTFTVYNQAVYKIASDYFHYDYGYILTEEIIEVPSVKKFGNFTKSNIPVRVGASQSTRKRFDLKPNQGIPVRGVLRSGWVVVMPGPNSNDGYIYAPKFVKLSLMEFEVIPYSGKCVARDKDIHIYSHPSLEANVISNLEKGYQLNITGKVKGAGWYQLLPFTDNTKGYVQMPGENL